MERYDVIIVGGGPAGSSCAWKLQRHGLSVLVIDKMSFPRDKPCAGWITPQVVESLQLDVAQYQQGRTWQSIEGFRCGMIGGRSVDVSYSKPVSYGIRRCEFDQFLLQRSGAELRLGEAVEHVRREDGRWVLNGNYSAPMLVGAGGHRCPIARQLGAREQTAASVVVAREIEFRIEPGKVSGGVAEAPALFFCKDLLGYGWCFRKGEYLNIGLGRTESRQLLQHVDEFVKFLRAEKVIAGEPPAGWRGHAYQLYEAATPRLRADGALLVGDAAGLAFAASGEGIRPAVESGLLAADAIAEAQGQYDAQSLMPYEAHLVKQLGSPAKRGLAARLPASWLTSLGAGLLRNSWFCQRVVLDRWFLRRRHKTLAMDNSLTARS